MSVTALPPRRRCLAALSVLALGPTRPDSSLAQVGGDGPAMRTVLQRLRAEVLGQPFARDARRALDQMAASGLWPDIDYADRSSGAWKPMRHLERLRSIAAAWAQPGNALERSAAARAAVENGLQAWLQRRPVSDNWWYNTVGAQLVLGPILLLLRDELPADVMSRAIGLLHDPGMVPPAQATGQNLIWYASQQMIRGVLRDDSDDIARASQALQREVRVTRQEGIQPDLSFHQHGAQLYSGGYGLAFLVDSTRAASLLAGTPWAFTPERLELLADYALRGIAPLVRGAWLDWGACGREYTRNSSVSRPRRLLAAISRLKPLVPSRSEDLAQLAARLEAGIGQAGATGNRHYWRSDFMVHQTKAGYCSVKMVSARTVGTESGNGENLLGFWAPFGVTYILRRGDEYDNLQPVWDWSSLPGLTAPAEVPSFSGYLSHDSRFVGALSDADSGLAAMNLAKLDTNAKLAWFFDGDLMLALGAGIRSNRAVDVRTTINQTRWVGDVSSDRGVMPAAGGEQGLEGLRWVWHDGVTYLLLDAPQARLRREALTIRENRANPVFGLARGQARLLALTLNHGRQPAASQYAYGVWLGAGRATDAGKVPAFAVLSNTTAVQAVYRPGTALLQAVFHNAGTLAVDERLSVKVDAPCLLMLRRGKDGYRVGVADPTWTLSNVAVELRESDLAPATARLAFTDIAANLPPYAWATMPRRR